jgi:hypothetical protein
MKARIIQTVEGHFVTHEIDADNLIPFMEIRGYAFAKFNHRPEQRAELQGHPVFVGVAGPMFDRDAIRYECPAAQEQLSK